MKLKEKIKEKWIKSMLGLGMLKVALDIKKAQNKQIVFPDLPNNSEDKWGKLTLNHLGALIPIGVFMIIGIWFKFMFWIGLGLYLVYNISTYRSLDAGIFR